MVRNPEDPFSHIAALMIATWTHLCSDGSVFTCDHLDSTSVVRPVADSCSTVISNPPRPKIANEQCHKKTNNVVSEQV